MLPRHVAPLLILALMEASLGDDVALLKPDRFRDQRCECGGKLRVSQCRKKLYCTTCGRMWVNQGR